MGHDHSHPHRSSTNLRLAFLLNLGSAIAEVAIGLWANSLVILSQAVHDFSDTLSLALSWFFAHLSQQKRTSALSYGYKRYSMLSAVITSIVLLCGSFFILTESVRRILRPEHSDAQKMLVFAVIGILVNGIAVLRLKDGKTMNEKAAMWHLLDDVLGWIAVLIAGLVIHFKDIHILDPIFSIGITLYVLWNVVKNFRQSILILMQGVPQGFDVAHLEQIIAALPGIKAVHDTHVWTLDGEHHILTTHLVLKENLDQAGISNAKLRAREIIEQSGIQHSTIEIELENEECKMKKC